MASVGAVPTTSGHRHHHHKRSLGERSEDVACEQAALAVFKLLDPAGTGFVQKAQVLPLWPALSRHVEGGSAEALLLQLRQRTAPIAQQDWMSLTDALRAVVGPRRFGSSLRRAEALAAAESVGSSRGGSPPGRYTEWAPSLPPVPGVGFKSAPRLPGASIPFSAAGERLAAGGAAPLGSPQWPRHNSASCPQLRGEPCPPSAGPALAAPLPPPVGSSRAAARYAAGARRLGFDPMSFGGSDRPSPSGSSVATERAHRMGAVMSSPSLGASPKDSPSRQFLRSTPPLQGSSEASPGGHRRHTVGFSTLRGAEGPAGVAGLDREAAPRRLEALPKDRHGGRSEGSSKETAEGALQPDAEAPARTRNPSSVASQERPPSTVTEADEEMREQVRELLRTHQRKGTFEGRRSEMQEEMQSRLGVDPQRFRELFKGELSRRSSKTSVVSRSSHANKQADAKRSSGQRTPSKASQAASQAEAVPPSSVAEEPQAEEPAAAQQPQAAPEESQAPAPQRPAAPESKSEAKSSSGSSDSDSDSSDESSVASGSRFAFYAGNLVIVPREEDEVRRSLSSAGSQVRRSMSSAESPVRRSLSSGGSSHNRPSTELSAEDLCRETRKRRNSHTFLASNPELQTPAIAVWVPKDAPKASLGVLDLPPEHSDESKSGEGEEEEEDAEDDEGGVRDAMVKMPSIEIFAPANEQRQPVFGREVTPISSLFLSCEQADSEAPFGRSEAAGSEAPSVMTFSGQATPAAQQEAGKGPHGLALEAESRATDESVASGSLAEAAAAADTVAAAVAASSPAGGLRKASTGSTVLQSMARDALFRAHEQGTLHAALMAMLSGEGPKEPLPQALPSPVPAPPEESVSQDEPPTAPSEASSAPAAPAQAASSAPAAPAQAAEGRDQAAALRKQALAALLRASAEGTLASALEGEPAKSEPESAGPRETEALRSQGEPAKSEPESAGPRETEALRSQVRNSMLKATREGRMLDILKGPEAAAEPSKSAEAAAGEEEEAADAAAFRSQVRGCLLEASREGRLLDVLKGQGEPAPEPEAAEATQDVEGIRLRTQGMFMQALQDGLLSSAFQADNGLEQLRADAKDSLRQALDGGSLGQFVEDWNRQDLNAHAKDTLKEALDDGSLQAFLEDCNSQDLRDLRAHAKEGLGAALEDGSLQAFLREREDSEADGLRDRLAGLLQESAQDGRLRSSLREVREEAPGEQEQLCSLAKATLLRAAEDGRLTKALDRMRPLDDGAAQEDEEDEEGEESDEDISALCMQVKGSLVGAAEDGTLATVLAEDPKAKPSEEEALASEEARALFLRAAQDGRLQAALQDARPSAGRCFGRHGDEEGEQAEELESLRAEAEGTLLKGLENGALQEAAVQAKAMKALSKAAVDGILEKAVAKAQGSAAEGEAVKVLSLAAVEGILGNAVERAKTAAVERDAVRALSKAAVEDILHEATARAKLQAAERQEAALAEEARQKAREAFSKALLSDEEEEEDSEEGLDEEALQRTKEQAKSALVKALLEEDEEEEEDDEASEGELERTKESARAALASALLDDVEEDEAELAETRLRARAAFEDALASDEEEEDEEARKADLLRAKQQAKSALLKVFSEDEEDEVTQKEVLDTKVVARDALEKSLEDDEESEFAAYYKEHMLDQSMTWVPSLYSEFPARKKEKDDMEEMRLKAKADMLKAANTGALASLLGRKAAAEAEMEEAKAEARSALTKALLEEEEPEAEEDLEEVKGLARSALTSALLDDPQEEASESGDDTGLVGNVRNLFILGAQDGSLSAALDGARQDAEDEASESGDDTELVGNVRNLFILGAQDGSLSAALGEARQDAEDEASEPGGDADLVAGLRSLLVQGAQDGSLSEALVGARRDAEEEEEEEEEEASEPGGDADLVGSLRSLLVQGAQDGSLSEALVEARRDAEEEDEEELRQKAKSAFLEAADDGRLASAFVRARPESGDEEEESEEEESEEEGADDLRDLMKSSLLKANGDGTLAGVLDGVRPVKESSEEAEETQEALRRKAFAQLVQAAGDGSLEMGLQHVRPDHADSESEEGSQEARDLVKGSLLKANRDGTLEALLEEAKAKKAEDALRKALFDGSLEAAIKEDGERLERLEGAKAKAREALLRSVLDGSLSGRVRASLEEEAKREESKLAAARAKARDALLRSALDDSLSGHVRDSLEADDFANKSAHDVVHGAISGQSVGTASKAASLALSEPADADSLVSFGGGSAEGPELPPAYLKVDDEGCVSFADSHSSGEKELPFQSSPIHPKPKKQSQLASLDESTMLPDDSMQDISMEEKPKPPPALPAKRRPGRTTGSIVAAAEAQQKRQEKLQQQRQKSLQAEPPTPQEKAVANRTKASFAATAELEAGKPAEATRELRRVQSSPPGGLLPPPGFDALPAEDLRDRLLLEMDLHRQTYEKMKDLERKVRQQQASARQTPHRTPQPRRFGVTDPQPYATPPVSLASVNARTGRSPRTPKRRGVYAPPLQTAPAPPRSQAAPAPPRSQAGPCTAISEARATAADARATVRSERLAPLSRAEASRTRVEAIAQLDSAGLNTWDVRQAEKVARYQDLKVFSESMWDSFFDWKEDANGVA